MLINLVRNSLKFTNEGAIRVEASYNQVDQELIIHVTDSGVGIDIEDIEKLFTRFGKLQRTSQMNSDGVGLGLTIVKKVVEANHGQIEVVSEGCGRGSSFILSMKMKAVEEA